MSFDLFLQCFQDGEPSALPLSLLERSFGPYTSVREENCRALHYPDGGQCELHMNAVQEQKSDFMVA
jgi:hypothetical protein